MGVIGTILVVVGVIAVIGLLKLAVDYLITNMDWR